MYDVEVLNKHVKGINNYIAYLLSRWKDTPENITSLNACIQDLLLFQVNISALDLNCDI